jgi:hypothetical protein
VTVRFDDEALVSNLAVPGWLPQPRWRVGATAATGEREGDLHSLRTLSIMTRRLPSVVPVALAISTNAQQYTHEVRGFTYFGGSYMEGQERSPHAAPLHLSAVSPSSGPIAGATALTVTGQNFAGGSAYVCRVGAQEVAAEFVPAAGEEAWTGPSGSTAHPAGKMLCTLPSSTVVGKVTLQIALVSEQYSPPVNFTYHGESSIERLVPGSGPRHGGTRVQISGEMLELGSHYVCEFNGSHVPAALAPSTVTEYLDFIYFITGIIIE